MERNCANAYFICMLDPGMDKKVVERKKRKVAAAEFCSRVS